ncbi:Dirigent protein [Rhynchospora pubera]|uniref:Dirigent protein n=1 Tax=Rhynchospora pubera TaxID=906938 RepID=A0AAV8CMF2_9POAL|nr:Dirigent protein [Rhynchospora pubera]
MASASPIPGKKEFKLHMYWNDISQGTEKTTVAVISPNAEYPNFGETRVMDVPLYDKTTKDKIIGRAQGVSLQADLEQKAFLLSFNIEFETPDLKGSTLQVMGRWTPEMSTKVEWSVVGGTGNYTLAKGIVYGRMLSTGDDSVTWIELDILGYYAPLQKPN